MQRAMVVAGWAVVGLAIPWSMFASGAEPIVTIMAEQPAKCWLLDPVTGRIFAAIPEARAVVEFDSASGKELRRFSIAGEPLELQVKHGRLLVSVARASSITILNLDTNEPAGTVELGEIPLTTFCSNADNPFGYAMLPVRREGSRYDMVQYDVVAGKILRRSPLPQFRHPFREFLFTISPDGRHLLAIEDPWDGGSATSLQFDEEHFTFQLNDSRRSLLGAATAGPAGRFWFLGRSLYPNDLSSDHKSDLLSEESGIREFEGIKVAAHPTRDLVVSVLLEENPVLCFQTFSEAKLLAKVKLITDAQDKSDENPYDAEDQPEWPERQALTFDAARNRVFFGWGQGASVVDLSPLDLPDAPMVLIDGPSHVNAVVGRPVAIPLALTDPRLMADARFEMQAPPEGAALDEQHRVVWTPSANQVGTIPIRIRATVGERSDILTIATRVKQPSISLGQMATAMSIDRAGRRAVVAVVEAEPGQGPFDVAQQAGELVLVDLVAEKIVARRKATAGQAIVCVTDTAVYFSGGQSATFESFSLEGLDDGRKMFLEEPVTGFAPLPGNRLLVLAENQPAVVDEETFEKVSFPGLGASIWSSRGYGIGQSDGPAPVAWLDGVVVAGPLAIDSETCQPRLLLDPGEMPLLGELRAIEPPPTPWARQLDHGGLLRRNQLRIGSWPGPAVLLPGVPLAAVACAGGELPVGLQPNDRTPLSLEFHELLEGQSKATLLLDEWSPNRLPSSVDMFNQPVLIQAAGDDRVAAVFLDELYVVPIPKEATADLREPIRFVPAIEPLEGTLGETVTIRFQTAGGRGKRNFELINGLAGAEWNAATGELKLDTAALWTRHRDKLEILTPDGNAVGPARDSYERLLGCKPKEVPLVVPLHVAVSDEDGDSGRLLCFFVVHVPEAELKPLMPDPSLAAQRLPLPGTQTDGRDFPKLLRSMQDLLLEQRRTSEKLAELDDKLGSCTEELGLVRAQTVTLSSKTEDFSTRLSRLEGVLRIQAVATIVLSVVLAMLFFGAVLVIAFRRTGPKS